MTAPGKGLDVLGSVSLALLQMLLGHSSLNSTQAVAVAQYMAEKDHEMVPPSHFDH